MKQQSVKGNNRSEDKQTFYSNQKVGVHGHKASHSAIGQLGVGNHQVRKSVGSSIEIQLKTERKDKDEVVQQP